MTLYGYTFIKEVENFNLDIFIPHLGWIGAKITQFKIYTRYGTLSYYLHDERLGKMYEFMARPGRRVDNKEEYENVAKAYLMAYPKNRNIL